MDFFLAGEEGAFCALEKVAKQRTIAKTGVMSNARMVSSFGYGVEIRKAKSDRVLGCAHSISSSGI